MHHVILGQPKKRWAEFFFISPEGALCNLLFHGYSVDNLMRTFEDLYYDAITLCEVELTAKPVEKTSKATDEQGNQKKFYIAEFSYKHLPSEEAGVLQTVANALKIWREDTLTGDAYIDLHKNYNPPVWPSRDEIHDAAFPTEEAIQAAV